MAKSKVRYLGTRGNKDVNAYYNELVNTYRAKYYNIYRASYKWKGIDYRQEDYIMRKLYKDGTVSAFDIKGVDIGFAPWTMQTHDMYGLPETIMLINEYGSPLIPSTPQVVDKEVCLGYIQRNKKPLGMIIDSYIKRICQVEMVIYCNLTIHKMPFLISVEEDTMKLQDIMSQLLNNEPVIFVEGISSDVIKAVNTGAPYIIDKLHEYKVGLENELKTYLGIDNQGAVEKREQLQLDEINAINDEINDNDRNFITCLKEWCKNIKDVLGYDIDVEGTSDIVKSTHIERDNSDIESEELE